MATKKFTEWIHWRDVINPTLVSHANDIDSVKIISWLNKEELAEYELQDTFEDLNDLADYLLGTDYDPNEIELTEEEFDTICNQTIWNNETNWND